MPSRNTRVDAKSRTNIAIYLLKDNEAEDQEILKPDLSLIRQQSTNCTIYYRDSHPSQPTQMMKYWGLNPDSTHIFSANVALVAVFRGIGAKKRTYTIVSGGGGRFLLNQDMVVERFGLEAALGIMRPDNVIACSRTKPENNPLQTRERFAKGLEIESFSIDKDRDLVDKASGRVRPELQELLGRNVEGSNALKLCLSGDKGRLFTVLQKIDEIYAAKKYQEKFSFIDNQKIVKDKKLKSELIEVLLAKINDNKLRLEDHQIGISVPYDMDGLDFGGFIIFRSENKCSSVVSEIGETDFFGDKRAKGKVSLNFLKRIKVQPVSQAGQKLPVEPLRGDKCLYAEISYQNQLYFLFRGIWRNVGKDYYDAIEKKIRETPQVTDLEIIDYRHKNEEAYNESLARALDGTLCDKKFIMYHGNQIELCDVLVGGNTFIAVKRFGKSSPLSHLFAQAVVAAKLITNSSEFIKLASEKFGQDFSHIDDKRFILAIIPERPGVARLPFFAKVALLSNKEELEKLGFKVELAYVRTLQQEPDAKD